MPILADKLARLSQLRPLAPAAVRSLAAAWDVRMVYESNSIEGNTLTLREVEVLLSTESTSPGKPVADHLAAKSLHLAWQALKTKASMQAEPSEADLLGAYHKLSGKERVGSWDRQLVGSLNRIAASVGGSVHEVETMGDLFIELPQDPVEKACCLHHRITRCSRFEDCSGKIARLAMNFTLLSAGYPPVSIPPRLRAEYYTALEAADSGDFPAWLAFITERLDEEFDIWLEALSEPSSTDL